jgi:mono/diheme cytochrome c family protein
MSGEKMIGITVALLLAAAASVAADIDFDRDIQPILSDNCYHCHGPDGKTRKAKLRLDTFEGATAVHDDWQAVVPGEPAKSEAFVRITTDDPDELMPPPDSNRELTDRQIDLLKQWIASGADYSQHWAFVPPASPEPPAVGEWGRNPIDGFIHAKLLEKRLLPEVEAPRRDLIRRLSLDLTGLPPTPQQVQAFLADDSADAYEKLVERLLASPHYGERMAWPWLDVARYADTNGYQGDRERTMWPWRDWVVDAFNRNMPYDQFTVWQLAGDMLPNASEEQKLATGFLRNHMINGEGGRIAEENRVEYIFDQVETVGTTWLGLTFNCCRCHDHKYDPLSQKDYYSMFAFFNRTRVNGGGGDPGTAPAITVQPAASKEKAAAITQQLAALEKQRTARTEALASQYDAWLTKQAAANAGEPAWTPLVPHSATSKNGQAMAIGDDGRVLTSGKNPANDTYIVNTKLSGPLAAVRLDALRHPSMTKGGIARSDSGNFVLTEIEFSIVNEDVAVILEIASATASYEQGPLKAVTAYDGNKDTGWAVWGGKPIDRDHHAVFTFVAPAEIGEGDELQVVLSHDSKHKHHNLGHFSLTAADKPPTKTPTPLSAALNTPADKRDAKQKQQLKDAFHKSDPAYQTILAEKSRLEKEKQNLSKGGAKVMVMADSTKRDTFVLNRGLYNQRGDVVTAAVPAALPPLPKGSSVDRLALARWLVAPENPLPARVTVNRLWGQVFGVGLVKTAENFGVQGERPEHEALLDWLALEFTRSGWDVKHMMRLMVTSAAYRQQSSVSPGKLGVDPENRLVSRGARHRMPSWMIRDQALAASGLLVPTLGGVGVNPYQPQGVWAEMSFGKKRYKQDSGDKLYRRSLYAFWRRIVGPTMFFDAGKRQVCEVKEVRTNTPLQAFAVLNDTTYVEAARAMGIRVLQSGKDDTSRIVHAFELVLARPPSAGELTVLLGAADRLRREYAADAKLANEYLTVGQYRVPQGTDAIEAAVYGNLCLTILNLDEALSKE